MSSKVSPNKDVISRLVEKDMRYILEKVFLQLDCQDLKKSYSVCKNWNNFLKLVFWKNHRTLGILRQRLKGSWEKENFKRVQAIVDGFACRENCHLNSRLCNCPLMCQEVTGSRLVILLNSKKVEITYNVNNEAPIKVTKLFDRPQYQMQLVMNNNLMPDEKVFLSRPIFFKNKHQSKRKVKVKTDIVIEIDGEDKSFLKCMKSEQILSRFQPYTGMENCQAPFLIS